MMTTRGSGSQKDAWYNQPVVMPPLQTLNTHSPLISTSGIHLYHQVWATFMRQIMMHAGKQNTGVRIYLSMRFSFNQRYTVGAKLAMQEFSSIADKTQDCRHNYPHAGLFFHVQPVQQTFGYECWQRKNPEICLPALAQNLASIRQTQAKSWPWSTMFPWYLMVDHELPWSFIKYHHPPWSNEHGPQADHI